MLFKVNLANDLEGIFPKRLSGIIEDKFYLVVDIMALLKFQYLCFLRNVPNYSFSVDVIHSMYHVHHHTVGISHR